MQIRGIEFEGSISIDASGEKEDVYIGKTSSCERIYTRISLRRIEPQGESDTDSVVSRIVDEGWRWVWIRVVGGIFSVVLDGGDKGRETNKKGGREMARMPHYACTPAKGCE